MEPIGLAAFVIGVGVLLITTVRWGRKRLPTGLGPLLIPIGMALLVLGIVLLVWVSLSRLEQGSPGLD